MTSASLARAFFLAALDRGSIPRATPLKCAGSERGGKTRPDRLGASLALHSSADFSDGVGSSLPTRLGIG